MEPGFWLTSHTLAALSQYDISPGARLLWLLIATQTAGRTKYDPDQWDIAQDELARLLGVGRRAVQIYQRELLDVGLVEVSAVRYVHRDAVGRPRPRQGWNRYRVRMPDGELGEGDQTIVTLNGRPRSDDRHPERTSGDPPSPGCAIDRSCPPQADVRSFDRPPDRSFDHLSELDLPPAGERSIDRPGSPSLEGGEGTSFEAIGGVAAGAGGIRLVREPGPINAPVDELEVWADLWLDEEVAQLAREDITFERSIDERLEEAKRIELEEPEYFAMAAPVDDQAWNTSTLARAGLWGRAAAEEQAQRRRVHVATLVGQGTRRRTPAELAAATTELLERVSRRDVPTLERFMAASTAAYVVAVIAGRPHGIDSKRATDALLARVRLRTRSSASSRPDAQTTLLSRPGGSR